MAPASCSFACSLRFSLPRPRSRLRPRTTAWLTSRFQHIITTTPNPTPKSKHDLLPPAYRAGNHWVPSQSLNQASHLQTHSWPIDDNDLSSFKQTFALSSQLLDLPSQPPLMEAV
ncbi:hypothetical protein CGCF413_v015276 [Colletotrichum fructicola]|nr:hypothetical protein CGCF413_v015276 [Colletotrichum fructicola]